MNDMKKQKHNHRIIEKMIASVLLLLISVSLTAQQVILADLIGNSMPPMNNDLCDAIFIDVDASCAGYAYTNIDATNESEPLSCGGELYSTVWFEFESPCSGSVDIVLDTEFGSDVEVTVFQENLDFDCNTNIDLTVIACDLDVLGIFQVSGLLPDEYYYVRVQTIPSTDENFCIEINTPDGPSNDFLCNAIELTVNDHCDGNLYNNIDATEGPDEPGGCSGGVLSYQTVWFSFQAPAEGYVVIITDKDEDIVRNLYHCGGGECDDPGTLILAGCESSDNYYLTETGMTPGDWYYIRVRVDDPPYETDFCIEVLTPPFNDDLCEHIELSLGADCTGYEYTNENATVSASPFHELAEAPGCGDGLENTVWFTFDTPASGNIGIKTDAAGGANVERHVYYWEYDDSECDGYYLIEVECNDDDTDEIWYVCGLDPTEDEHILSIQTLDDPEGVEFCVEVFEPIPENDELCDAVELEIGDLCSGEIYNNIGATVGIGPGEFADCYGDIFGTVWFTFEAPLSGSVTIETESSEINFERSLYARGIGFDCFAEPNLVEIACSEDNVEYGKLNVCDLVPGNTYYLRLMSVIYFTETEHRSANSGPDQGDYCVHIKEGLAPVITLDEAEIEICNGQSEGVELIYEQVTNDPTLYSIDYDGDANADGLADIIDEPFPMGIFVLNMNNIDFTNSEVTGSIVVKNASCEAPPVNFTIDVYQPPSSASLSLIGSNEICIGGVTSFGVDVLGGESPYTLIYTDGVDDFIEFNYESNLPIIVSPTVDVTYSIVSAIDSKGCEAELLNNSEDVVVNQGPGIATLSGGGSVCQGNGTNIWFEIADGTPPYTVEYSNGMDVISIPNYQSGDPIIVSPLMDTDYFPEFVVDFDGCLAGLDGFASVTVFDPILDATLEGGGEICDGESETIWFTITGGTGPYEVTYFDGLFFETVSNYFSGELIEVTPFATTTYTPVSIEDINSCGGPVNGMAEVVVNQSPNFANLLGDAAICEGDPAIISFDIVGGQSPFYVEYTDGIEIFSEAGYTSGNSIFLYPNSTTTYTPVIVTDFNNCEAGVLEGEALITVYEYPGDAILEGGGEICSGASSTIWFDIPAGTPPYYVEYFDGMDFIGIPNYISGVPIIVSPLVTTDYFSSTVIDANGCYAGIDGLVTVIVNDGPSLALINGTQAICPDATADIFVDITGGTSPYELVLFDGDSEFIIEDYLSGELITVSPDEDTDYTIIQITDANGCESQVNDGVAEITILDGPGVCTLDNTDEEICIGFGSNIFFNIESGNGPYTVTYTDETDEYTIENYNNGELIPVFPDDDTFYYPVSVIDSDGCEGTMEGLTAVYVLPGPEEVIVEGSGALCSGEDPSISIIIDGGFPPYIIVYTDGDDLFEEDEYDSGDLIYLEPEGITDYTVLSVTDDDGCMVEVNEIITLFYTENPGLATMTGMASICPGGEAQIFVDIEDGEGPFSLVYFDGTENNSEDDYNSGDPIDVTPILTSDYSLISVFDVNGCEAETTGSAMVEVSDGPGLVLAEGSQTICMGDDAEISFTISSGLAPFTLVYFDGLEEVTLPDYMSGEAIILSPENTTNNIPISIVDANGCPGEFDEDIIIEVLSRPDAVLLEEEFEICRGEEIELMVIINNGEGPFTIVYNDGINPENMSVANFNIGESIVLKPEFSTTFTAISITDVNGCEGTIAGSASVVVEDPPIIDLTDQYCSENMTTYTLEFMTDGTMLVSDIGTVVSNGGGMFTVSDIPEGMSVTISSTSMLASCLTEIIFNAPDCDCINIDPPISGGDVSLCEGEPISELSVTVNVNETADWYDEASNGNLLLMGSLVYTPSMAGLYYAETRDLDTDCVSLVRTGVELRINDIPSVTITGNSEICRDQESTILDAGGNYSSYLWSSGEDTQTIEVFSEGEYSVMVSDEFGCLGEASVTVNELEPPTVEITGLTSICSGQSTELGLGDNYETILWSTGEDTEVINVQDVGEYSVMVTDINGCEGEASVMIVAFEDPQVEITGIASICTGQSTELGLGDSYESVLWSTGEDTEIITVQEVGEYSVMVTDINGCTGEASITVNEFDIEEISIIGDAVICEGAFSNLSIEGTFESYMWSTGEDSESISVSEAGLYSLTVMDENGCRSEDTFELMVEDGLGFETKFLANKSVCVGDTVHLFDISEIDNAADEYLWDFGDGNNSTERDPEHTYTMPGSYDVQLIATIDGCINKSIFKQIDVFDCRREIYDDSNFAYINVAPNPSDGTFSLILEFITETDALIELYTVNGILLHSEFFSGKLIRKNYDLRETGVYFIKVKTPFYSKAKKVLVHK